MIILASNSPRRRELLAHITRDFTVQGTDVDESLPADEAEARQMLARLSGRWHSVFTGVSLVQGERHLTFSCETRVRFFDLTAAEIDAYIATGECMDKAGAYGIQGYGSLLVQEIQGDYFNVVGLPVSRLYRALNDFEQK